MTCKPWFGCGLVIQIKRPPPPSTADIEASTSETRSKIAAGFVSAAFSCGATKPFCANLNRDRLISFLRSLSVVCRSISPSASTAAGSKILPREKITARSVSRPLPNCVFSCGTRSGAGASTATPKFRSAASPALISSSCDLFLAKPIVLHPPVRPCPIYSLARSVIFPCRPACAKFGHSSTCASR